MMFLVIISVTGSWQIEQYLTIYDLTGVIYFTLFLFLKNILKYVLAKMVQHLRVPF
jgi:hypothetical protein